MAKTHIVDFHREEDPILRITPEGLGPWSISKLKMLQKCPLQFYLKYIKRMKEDLVQSDEDQMLTLGGRALHEILDMSLRGLDLKTSYARARLAYKKDISDQYWEEKILTKEYNITSFLERIEDFSSRNKVDKILTEQRIGMTKDYTPTGFFADDVYFRGVIDLAIILKNQDAVIIDHKTGGSAKFGMKHHDFQLNTYKPSFHYGVMPIRGAQTGIHFIGEGDVYLGKYESADSFHEHMELFEFYIKAAIERVISDGYFKYDRGSTACKYCEFKTKCSAGKKGTSGELMMYEEESRAVVSRFLNSLS